MPNKYQLLNELANETLKEITQSGESWIGFLNPNATACADMEIWNKRLKRWVNKGAKGIALNYICVTVQTRKIKKIVIHRILQSL